MSQYLTEQQRIDVLKAANALSGVGTRPISMPDTLATLFHPELSPQGLEQIIIAEAGLMLRVLKVANSPLFRRAGDVGSVRRAIELFGINTVRGIVTAAFLDRTLFRSLPGALIDAKLLKRHGVAAASAAHLLAGPDRPQLAADAFQAAMLHDVGILIQQLLEPDVVNRTVQAVQAVAGSMLAGTAVNLLTHAQGDYPHAECAATVFIAWHLPASLVEAVAWHHEPAQAQPAARELAALVHVADCVAIRAGFGIRCEAAAEYPDDDLLTLAGVGEQDLPQVQSLLAEITGAVEVALR